jgi:phenylpropionate dioxygenase-like ring-hydroxylating dioxygenase large terminal subunit
MISSGEAALLERVWFPVARSMDVAAVGDIRPARLLGRDLTVYRTGAGLTVSQGHCPHRGAALWRGRLVDDHLECPYHGWRYGADGDCVAIPSLGLAAPSSPVTLKTYRVAETCGLVWTCLGNPVLPPPSLPPAATGRWSMVVEPGPYDIDAGMRAVTENFRDISHLPFVHCATMGPNQPVAVEPYHVERQGWTLSWTVHTRYDSRYAWDGHATVRQYSVQHDYLLLMPATSVLISNLDEGGRYLIVQCVTPLDQAGEQTRQFNINGIDDEARRAGVNLDELVEWEVAIQREDREILASIQPKEAPLDPHAQANTRADRYSIMYRKLYQELIASVDDPVTAGSAAAVR